MKVVQAEIFSVKVDLSPDHMRHTANAGWRPVILRLTTDDGLTGLGEAGLAYGLAHHGAVGMVRDFVEAFVLGADPMQREAMWNDMHRLSFWGGSTGPVVNAAMSAVDIALWDIAGKASGQPIWQLLGGKVNDSLRCYASQIQFGWDGGWTALSRPEDYARSATAAMDAGYDAVKVDPILIREDGSTEPPHRLKGALDAKILRRATSRMEAIRDAIGPDADIILELHSLTSLTGGQQLAEACRETGLFMVEEAVNYNSDRPAKALRQRLPHARLTGGERIYTRWGFRGYLEDGSFDMIQPDFCLVGGISEGRKICDMAHAYEVTVQGHVCGSPISTAAALHVETAIPNFQIHEHHVHATCSDNTRICIQDHQPENGRFTVGTAPGLGLELDDDYLSRVSSVVTLR